MYVERGQSFRQKARRAPPVDCIPFNINNIDRSTGLSRCPRRGATTRTEAEKPYASPSSDLLRCTEATIAGVKTIATKAKQIKKSAIAKNSSQNIVTFVTGETAFDGTALNVAHRCQGLE